MKNMFIGDQWPAALGDAKTTESYRLLCARTIDLALQRDAINEATAQRLRWLLEA